MINFYNQVPSVYPSASRDFQYLSWLINIVLNSVKHNVDNIYNLPNTESDPKLTELLAMTLGFKVKRNYDKKQLTALVAILPSVLKYKGTEKAIKMAANALVMATGSLGDPSVEINGAEVIVVLPKDLIDITLFLDLLDYILPAGMTCRINRKNESRQTIENIELRQEDSIVSIVADDFKQINHDSSTMAGLYELDDVYLHPEFSANIRQTADGLVPNSGLLANTVIPVLANSTVTATTEASGALFSTEADGNHLQLLADGLVQLNAIDAV